MSHVEAEERVLLKPSGTISGISSCAALAVACRLAQLEQFSKKTIVAILPDVGERYLSTSLFEKTSS
jgi:cysteine synthase A